MKHDYKVNEAVGVRLVHTVPFLPVQQHQQTVGSSCCSFVVINSIRYARKASHDSYQRRWQWKVGTLLPRDPSSTA